MRAARREHLLATLAVGASVGAFGFVFGLAAREQGLSLWEAMALSLIPFAGASQLAAVGYLEQALPWLTIVLLTALINARHLLYSASLAPGFRGLPLRQRLGMAQVLTDETFALASSHFVRIGRVDVGGYWIAGLVGVYIPWNVLTVAGYLAGGGVADPARLGLDVIFPAVMAGLAVGLTTGRIEAIAAGAGAVIGVGCAVIAGPAVGIVAGAVLGPAVALVVSR
jgi:4-azaleucine resistance transporter AzlC